MSIKDKSLVKVHPNERIDLPDFAAVQDNTRAEARESTQYEWAGGKRWGKPGGPVGNAPNPSGFHAHDYWFSTNVLGAVDAMLPDSLTGLDKCTFHKPFLIGLGGANEVARIHRGNAIVGVYDTDVTPETEHGVHIGDDDGPLTIDVDFTGKPATVSSPIASSIYVFYVSASFDDTSTSARVFWNNAASNEVSQSVSTRRSVGWNVHVELTTFDWATMTHSFTPPDGWACIGWDAMVWRSFRTVGASQHVVLALPRSVLGTSRMVDSTGRYIPRSEQSIRPSILVGRRQ